MAGKGAIQDCKLEPGNLWLSYLDCWSVESYKGLTVLIAPMACTSDEFDYSRLESDLHFMP